MHDSFLLMLELDFSMQSCCEKFASIPHTKPVTFSIYTGAGWYTSIGQEEQVNSRVPYSRPENSQPWGYEGRVLSFSYLHL